MIGIQQSKVRLGISAPLDISVHRLEVAQAIARDRAAYARELARDPRTNTRPSETLASAVKAVCEELRNSMAFLSKQGGQLQASQSEQYRRLRDRLMAAMVAEESNGNATHPTGGPPR